MGYNTGLVLTGGGARGAYQVGVLQRIAEIWKGEGNPFPIISGVSSGAINGALLAAHTDDFAEAAKRLWKAWQNLEVDKVFRTDTSSVFGIGAKLLRDISLGGLLHSSTTNHLLNTEPLLEFLQNEIDFSRIQKNIADKHLQSLAISATDYYSGMGVTFFDDGSAGFPEWIRTNRCGRRSKLTHDHLMASAAIPIFFPPIQIGDRYYGDGCLRLPAPLSPAIHLGAEKIFAISIRHQKQRPLEALTGSAVSGEVNMVQIMGVILNAVFLDALETDIERMERINSAIAKLQAKIPEEELTESGKEFRVIPVFVLRPSKDLGSLASQEFERLPKVLRYMLRGIGATQEKGWDLVSYLAFDSHYTERLLELGYEDAKKQEKEILEFLNGNPS